MQKLIKITILLICVSLLTGCTWFRIYRPSVQQGNLISDATIAQLHSGMNQDQVQYLMGTPVLTNTFDPNRWDYVYTFKPNDEPRVQRHVTLYFDNSGILQHIQYTPMHAVTGS